jgi:hypothetical protein
MTVPPKALAGQIDHFRRLKPTTLGIHSSLNTEMHPKPYTKKRQARVASQNERLLLLWKKSVWLRLR